MPASFLVLDRGTRAGLTGWAPAAISLAEPDWQRQGQHKAWKFFSYKHVSLPVTCVHVNIYPPMAFEDLHSILYLYLLLACLKTVEINRGSFTCRSLKLWCLTNKHPIHTVHHQRELHRSKNIAGTSDLRACKRIFLQKLKGWIVQPLQH